ncbi:MAG: ABC transporter permease [Prevotella sp.]|nr:ABC transporter permease [Staphylococcus sp.]MCM1350082.1 ABC transporter permease [Prevotella sp.]
MNKRFQKLATPYLIWLYILALFPAIFMFGLMFFDMEGIDTDEIAFTFENFKQLAEPSTLIALFNSLKFSVISTALCILLGYITAYFLYQSHIQNKFLVLIILILPMWSNLLLRTQALANIMEPNNIFTSLFHIQVKEDATGIAGGDLAVIIGSVFTYLPFMILPIYTALEKIDPMLEEASLDLGSNEFTTFRRVTLPLSLKGVVTGSVMVFLPCMSGFAIPEILGKGNIVMIGNIIEQFFKNMNYNIGSLLAVVILILILASIALVNKFDKDGETVL